MIPIFLSPLVWESLGDADAGVDDVGPDVELASVFVAIELDVEETELDCAVVLEVAELVVSPLGL